MAGNSITSGNTQSTPSFARWTILSVTTISSFMAALDTNIVTIALPKISSELSSGLSSLGWVITGYILATAVFLLQSGKIGDKYGKKRIYLIGFAIFGISSSLCGLSQNIQELVGFRVIQGIGSSMLAATAIPLVFESFPPNERGSAVGVNSTAWAVGAITGPVLGGFLVAFDWRLIFFINVPIAAAAIPIGIKRIPFRPGIGINAGGINIISSIFLGVAVTTALVWLTFFDYLYALASLLFTALFALNEYKSRVPLLNRELIGTRGFIYCIAGLSILQLAFIGTPFAMSFYYQSILNFSPIVTGLYIAPLPIALVIANPIAGRLSDKLTAPTTLSVFGAILEGLGSLFLGFEVLAQPQPLLIGLLLALIGLGGGFIWTPMISSALRFARAEIRGVANGTAFTVVDIGFGAGIAFVIGVSASFLPPQIISQIYLGQLGNLSSVAVELFRAGMARSLLGLGLVNFLSLPILLLARKEQNRAPKEGL